MAGRGATSGTLHVAKGLCTYLSSGATGKLVLSAEAVRVGPEEPAVVLGAPATSGNCSRKLARSSSPGFCELVL